MTKLKASSSSRLNDFDSTLSSSLWIPRINIIDFYGTGRKVDCPSKTNQDTFGEGYRDEVDMTVLRRRKLMPSRI
ncbi:hypothetical protein C5167_009040 [Papaver somniferum]|uniref:Uncharacterized protein n=1 Tax=Papaver somniferum TaxID=3469 RepID=A0A4Y7JXQ5_PAPSO|nr:hypothetical protein C5167_009040 [Papaver somniferum]